MPFGVRLLLLQFACAHTARRPLCLPRPDAPRPRVGQPHSRSPCPCEPCLGMSQAQPELLPQKHLLLRLSAMGNRVKTQAARIGAWFVKLYGTLPFPLKYGSKALCTCLLESLGVTASGQNPKAQHRHANLSKLLPALHLCRPVGIRHTTRDLPQLLLPLQHTISTARCLRACVEGSKTTCFRAPSSSRHTTDTV